MFQGRSSRNGGSRRLVELARPQFGVNYAEKALCDARERSGLSVASSPKAPILLCESFVVPDGGQGCLQERVPEPRIAGTSDHDKMGLTGVLSDGGDTSERPYDGAATVEL